MSSRSVEAASTRSGGPGNQDGDRQLMSKEHKDLLRKHRADIIENMYPDDVLTFLQARAIFTPKDVSRVKEKGTVDNQNEHLLDILLRKPDRGFRSFLDGLKRSEQDHVAELLDTESAARDFQTGATGGGSSGGKGAKSKRSSAGATNYSDDEYLSPPSTPRKRKAQTVNIRANVSGVEHEEADVDESEDEEDDVLAPQRKRRNRRATLAPLETRDEALVARLNEELLEAYILETRNLKDVLRTGVTQQTIQARKVIMETLAFLNKQRRELRGIFDGSVIFCVYCPTVDSLEDLWRNYKNGTLQNLFDKVFVNDDLKLRQRYKLKTVKVEVTISQCDYHLCKEEILTQCKDGETCKDLPVVTKDLQRQDSDKENVTKAADLPQESPIYVKRPHSPFPDRDPLCARVHLQESESTGVSGAVCSTMGGVVPYYGDLITTSSCSLHTSGVTFTTAAGSPPSSGVYSADGSLSGDSFQSDLHTSSALLWEDDLSVGSLSLSLS